MKRMITWMAAALAAAIMFLPVKVNALSAERAILLDADTGRVLLEKNADMKSLIASTTKIMTALIVCEQCNVLDRMTIPKEAVGIEGSSMYLQAGEILTVQDLLYGLMLRSGNDAAVALAIYCGGTVEGFAQLMNDKARKLGLTGTHFENPHGLDSPEHYSTARDLALLTAYAMKNPVFAKTVSAKVVSIGSRRIQNHNKLLWRLAGADGVKTGYTKAAGRILVSSAMRSGRRLIAVTIDAPDDWNDHAHMIDSGFRNYKCKQIVTAGDRVGTRSVVGGTIAQVDLLATEDFCYSLADNESVDLVLGGGSFVFAPVTAGEIAGKLYICLKDKVIGEIPLIYGENIEIAEEIKVPFWKSLLGVK